MESVKLQVRSLNLPEYGCSDGNAGPCLSELVVKTLSSGQCPPTAVAIRGDRAELVSLAELKKARLQVPQFLASLSRSNTSDGEADAVGLLGVFRAGSLGNSEPVAPVALVFLEWGDCSWWFWRALLDSQGAIVPETVTVSCATDGDPMPGKIGRWWSFGRRAKIKVDYNRVGSDETRNLVH